MLATTSTNAANIHMSKNPGYDPEKDFQVVGVIGSTAPSSWCRPTAPTS